MNLKPNGNRIQIAKTAIISEGVRFRAPTLVGSRAFIGYNCIIGYEWNDINIESKFKRNIPRRSQIASEIDNRTTVIDPGVWIYANCVISTGTKIGKGTWCDVGCFIGEHTTIGKNVWIHYGARIYNKVKIGEKSNIGGFVCNRSRIGKKVTMFGSLIHRLDNGYPRINNRAADNEKSPVVCDNVVIGWGAVIVGGIRIGKSAQIGALSIITKDIEPKQRVPAGYKI